jgi:thiamine pyrophosphate-dependent acetolactate synthase large subunit-like protein
MASAIQPELVRGAARFRETGRGLRGQGHNLQADPADLDDAIIEMIHHPGPVIFDCVVEKHENCFPMIPSGKAHNEMILGEVQEKDRIEAGGAVLV